MEGKTQQAAAPSSTKWAIPTYTLWANEPTPAQQWFAIAVFRGASAFSSK